MSDQRYYEYDFDISKATYCQGNNLIRELHNDLYVLKFDAIITYEAVDSITNMLLSQFRKVVGLHRDTLIQYKIYKRGEGSVTCRLIVVVTGYCEPPVNTVSE